MKKLIFSIALTLVYSSKIFTQEVTHYDSLTSSPQQQFEFITQNLDLTDVSSGLLKDKCLQLLPIANFTGQNLTDSNYVSGIRFSQLFATLSGMAINSSYSLPQPSIYTNETSQSQQNKIVIGGIHYKYQSFKSNVLENNLVSMQGGQLSNVPNTSETPFETETAFLVSPLTLKSKSLVNHFIFKSSLLYTNTTKTINTITIDFGDNRGDILVNLDSTYTVDYDTTGVKIITTTIIYTDNTILKSHAKFRIDPPSINTREYDDVINLGNIYATQSHNGEFGSANVTVQLACGHENLQKPLIWVEGFNPKELTDIYPITNLHANYMNTILNGPLGIVNSNFLRDYLEEEGYDLVYVDFENGGDWVQKSAYVLQEVIRKVNQIKAQNGSTEKNIVLGESLGGLIAKYALRKMELANEDHQTKTYISMDSPHKGANIPLGAQYATKHIPHINIAFTIPLWQFFTNIGDMRLGEQMLNNRAAKQMLLYQAADDFSNQTGSELVSSEHSIFYTEYNALGDLENCETLMSSNGSGLGTNGGQGYQPGDELLKIKFNNTFLHNTWINHINTEVNDINAAFAQGFQGLGASLVWLVGSIIADGGVNIRINALPNYSTSRERIYKGHVHVRFLLAPIVFSHRTVKVKKVQPYDSAPGGFFDLPLSVEVNTLPPFMQLAFDNDNISVIKTFNFIPTFSALDLPNSYKTTPYANLSNLSAISLNSSAIRTVNTNSTYPYYTFENTPTNLQNSLHIRIYNRNSRWFLFHLVGNNTINDNLTLSTQSFNFGVGNLYWTSNFENTPHKRTTSRIDFLTHITNTGKIYINKSNRIGFINTDNGPYTVAGNDSNPTHFTVSIKPKCNTNSKIVLVDNGGLIQIGENENQTGDLHLLDGATLTIGNGGVLKIKRNSKLIIHPNAQLIIKDGATIINEGKIEVLNNAKIEYHDGASITMNNQNSEIHFNGGDLWIMQNAIFRIEHPYGINGFLRFSSYGQHIFGEDNSKISLTGDGNTRTILKLDEDADFWNSSTDNLKSVHITNAKIEMEENSRINATHPLSIYNVNFTSNSINRGVVSFDKTNVYGSTFNNVKINAIHIYRSSAELLINNSIFNYPNSNPNTDNVISVIGKKFKVQSSTINTGVNYAIKSNNLSANSKIYNCTINANSNGASFFSNGIIDNSNVELIVKNSIFNDLASCINKTNGSLSLKCNQFNNFYYGGVNASTNCVIKMSSSFHMGYNKFIKNSNSPWSNIYLDNIQFFHLISGYNSFDPSGTLPIIYGTIQIPQQALNYVHGHKNNWNPNSPTFIPPASRFNIQSSITSNNIPVIIQDPILATCGQFDPNDPLIPIGILTPIDYVSITTTHFSNVNIKQALLTAINHTELIDSTKDDLMALDYLTEIVQYKYRSYDENTKFIIHSSLELMKQTIQHAIANDKISISQNQNYFTPRMNRYVNSINQATIQQVNKDNYRQQFNLEMDKVNLLHIIGKRSSALDIMYNMENCGLDSLEQKHVNHWKYQIETEKAKIEFGYQAEFKDTLWTDTLSYIQPIKKAFGNFGSQIISPNSITFSNCTPGRQQSFETNFDKQADFSIYPNPSKGLINIAYNLEEDSNAKIIIYSIDGKKIFDLECSQGLQTHNIHLHNVERGIYFYSYIVNGVNEKRGQIIIQE